MLQAPDRATKGLLELADYMENVDPTNYRQSVYNDGCGRGCIAFHAMCRMGIAVPFSDACYHLGISRDIAHKLFHADAGRTMLMGITLREPTPKEAARAIRHLAVTGEVPANWTKH